MGRLLMVKQADCKSVAFGCGGSNPPLPTNFGYVVQW